MFLPRSDWSFSSNEKVFLVDHVHKDLLLNEDHVHKDLLLNEDLTGLVG